MNIKTKIFLTVLFISVVVTGWISYVGYGINTQDDPVSVREGSIQNRRIHGGGSSFGK